MTCDKKGHRISSSLLRPLEVLRSMALLAGTLAISGAATAFQIAPMGSAFESKLTNETENSLANVAERLGVLIKGRVHEEITQLGMGCPVDPGNLAQDLSCSTRDLPFVTPYVIYGVRWNDLPPFKLSPDEGNCTYLGKSCNVKQTIRFSTQPLCWYCLFKDAEKKAQTRLRIPVYLNTESDYLNCLTVDHDQWSPKSA